MERSNRGERIDIVFYENDYILHNHNSLKKDLKTKIL